MGHAPAWYAGVILLLLACLMAAHLGILWVGTLECDRYADVLLERAALDPTYEIAAANAKCANMEQDIADAATQYIAMMLALLTGAGHAFGAHSRRKDDADKIDEK